MRLWFLMLVIVASLAASSPGTADDTKDADGLRGTWTAVSAQWAVDAEMLRLNPELDVSVMFRSGSAAA